MTVEVHFTLNRRPVSTTVDGSELLCDCLRVRLQHTGTRIGCHEGVCGSCNVIVDGTLVRSCLMLAAQADGCDVVTVEGLAGEDGLSPLQRAFIDHGAVQCGFCTPGLLMTATALLDEDPHPSTETLVEALAGNLCRCTGYTKVVDAIASVTGAEG
jgi:carbon-monoxide dehydrogenase small subunit